MSRSCAAQALDRLHEVRDQVVAALQLVLHLPHALLIASSCVVNLLYEQPDKQGPSRSGRRSTAKLLSSTFSRSV